MIYSFFSKSRKQSFVKSQMQLDGKYANFPPVHSYEFFMHQNQQNVLLINQKKIMFATNKAFLPNRMSDKKGIFVRKNIKYIHTIIDVFKQKWKKNRVRLFFLE